jgi:pre-rRNA-processing protein TSR4
MWAGGDDWSDTGEQVRLYLPTLYAKNKPLDPSTTSFIGGSSSNNDKEASPQCAICHNPLFLLVHLIIPSRNQQKDDRCVEILACNKATCLASTFQDNALCYGGAGAVVCQRSTVTNDDRKQEMLTAPKSNAATANDDDWTTTTDDGDNSVEDLEAKLAAMEASMSNKATTTAKSDKPRERPKSSTSTHQFPSFPLSSLLEPPCDRLHGPTDDDDVGISSSGTDDKIQAMLAKYMAEEEDEGILSALKGAGVDGGSGGGKERDERLSAAERALLSYSDRLKRSPRQVVRHAYGGVPMWSM